MRTTWRQPNTSTLHFTNLTLKSSTLDKIFNIRNFQAPICILCMYVHTYILVHSYLLMPFSFYCSIYLLFIQFLNQQIINLCMVCMYVCLLCLYTHTHTHMFVVPVMTFLVQICITTIFQGCQACWQNISP